MKQAPFTTVTLYLSVLALWSLFPGQSVAQESDGQGWVVTNAKDTLFGTIKNRKSPPFGKVYTKIRFKGKRGKKRFGPKDIIAYQMGNRVYERIWLSRESTFLTEHLRSVEGDGQKQFIRVAAKGNLIHYIDEIEVQGEEEPMEIDYFRKKGSPRL
ncbi:hypothetical protein [Maribacter sp. 2-571]|uniref:hypothetical protein n=1 Tax=Maribacter sp. 2-571 TaxID=3417569 RepID=UPI003D33964B